MKKISTIYRPFICQIVPKMLSFCTIMAAFALIKLEPGKAFTITNSQSLLLGRQSTNQVMVKKPPKPPDSGTPGGHRTPAITRPEASCPEMEKPLTALFANNGNDLTISQYPTFWFYIPYAPEKISSMEFLLLDARERKTIYHTQVKLTNQPGIIKITIPSESKYALEVDQLYRWRFHLDCKPDTTDDPDLVVNGWVRRVPSSSEVEMGYDEIANLAELHFANPENQDLSKDWANLLESLGFTGLEQEQFVESELITLQN
ncbi:MAG: DUF928 domain-containing protein [Moorea sp. SIO2B7]|nr:DUF928 domain-containing protein [Moorena sp. SIO2B7]